MSREDIRKAVLRKYRPGTVVAHPTTGEAGLVLKSGDIEPLGSLSGFGRAMAKAMVNVQGPGSVPARVEKDITKAATDADTVANEYARRNRGHVEKLRAEREAEQAEKPKRTLPVGSRL